MKSRKVRFAAPWVVVILMVMLIAAGMKMPALAQDAITLERPPKTADAAAENKTDSQSDRNTETPALQTQEERPTEKPAEQTDDSTLLAPTNTNNSLTTIFAGGSGQQGAMFDISTNDKGIKITSLDVHIQGTNSGNIQVYYKANDTYVGNETNSAAWTLNSTTSVTGAGDGNPTAVDIGDLVIPPNDTYAIYVYWTGYNFDTSLLRYTSGANTYSNDDLQINLGAGVAGSFGGGSSSNIFTPRTWNGTIYYETFGCHNEYDGVSYVCSDASYDFEDISSTGTAVTLGDDASSSAISTDFLFNYYGTDYPSVYINSNGYLSFGAGSTSYSAQQLPDPATPNNIIAGWWEDLDPAQGGTIHYQTLGYSPDRRFVVQFTNVAHHSTATPVTFQFKLFEGSNIIEVHYQNSATDGGIHSAGIENSDGSVGLSYYYGVAGGSNHGVRYAPGRCRAQNLDYPSDDFTTNDASAIQSVIGYAFAGETIRIYGTCVGVNNLNGTNQTAYIDKNLTLEGDPVGGATLHANLEGRVLFIGNAAVTLRDLRLTGGESADQPGGDSGGGIYLDFLNSALTLDGVHLIGNHSFSGGGIYTNGNSNINIFGSSELHENEGIQGGLLFTSGSTVTFNDVFAYGNKATRGGVVYASGSTVNIIDSVFDSNEAVISGGAIYATGGNTQTEISNSTISNNGASILGGALANGDDNSVGGTVTITNSAFTGNHVDALSVNVYGGAIYNNGSLEMSGGAITNNETTSTSGLGWGTIYNSSTADLTLDGTFLYSNSTSYSGGGISNHGTANIKNSSFWQNESRWGGAISNYPPGNATITNSTVSQNSLFQTGYGGGIYNQAATLTLRNSTLSDNNVVFPIGEGDGLHNASGTLYLYDTIIANSSGGRDCYNSGTIVAYHSLIENNDGTNDCGLTNGVDGNITGQDPTLGPMQGNGGPTLTRALQVGSPAIDAGYCSDGLITTSQNGLNRPLAFGQQYCDIGAYERLGDGSADLLIGQNFRKQELTTFGVNLTNIINMNDTFKTHADGRFFYRFCADFDQQEIWLTDNQDVLCRQWADLSIGEKDARVPSWSTTPLDNGGLNIDIYNTLRDSAFDYWQGAAATQETALTTEFQTAIDGTLEAIREQSYILAIYADEFFVDATRTNLTAAGGADIINDEIEDFENAHQQYVLGAMNLILAAQRPLPQGTVGDFYTELDLELLALLSRKQAETTMEIAQRKRRLADEQVEIDAAIVLLEEEYGRLQRNLTLFVTWSQKFPDPNQVYLDNHGPELAIALEELANLADSYRSSNNVLGYRDDYVPLATFPEIRIQFWGGAANTNGGYLKIARDAEDAARTAFLTYVDNAGSVSDAINNLETGLNDELEDLCGINVSGPSDWDKTCGNPNDDTDFTDGGAMGLSRINLIAAGKKVDLAYQHVTNMTQLILIEEELSGQVIVQLQGAAQDIALSQLAIGKLNAVQTLQTDFSTDTDSVREEETTSVRVYEKVSVTASANPFDISAEAEIGVEIALENSFTEASEQTWGTTRETTRNPNEEAVAEYEKRQTLRLAEKEATILGAESAAEVERLLLQQTDALIELDIAHAEYNAILAEHNSLVTQYQGLLKDNEYTDLSANTYLTNPALRIISDNENRIAHERFDILANYAYLAAKALEYELLTGATIPYQDLYQARTVDEVLSFFSNLNSTYVSLLDTSALADNKLSLAKDILRLTDTRINNMLPFTVDPFVANWPSRIDCNTPIISVATTLRTCLLQAFLLEQRVAGTEQIVFSFPSHLEDFYDGSGNDYNVRITPLQNSKPSGNCSSGAPCSGVWVNLLMEQYTDNGPTPRLYLTHDGQSAYLDNNSDIVYYRPSATRFPGQAIPAGFPAGSALRQSMNINVNHVGEWQPGVSATSNFSLRSAVVSGWQIELDLDSTLNDDLQNQFDAITDLELRLQTMYLTVNQQLAAVQAEMEALQAQGNPIPAELQAEHDQLVEDLRASRNQGEAVTDDEKSAVLNSMIDSFKQTAVTAPYIDPSVTHGLYTGLIGAAGFTEFGIEIEATAVSGTQPIMATLCITCSASHNVAAIFNGTFVETGTLTDTFSLVSDPFVEDIAGNSVTKVITLTGSVINNGGTILGTYEEHAIDAEGRETLLASDLYASRPKRVPGAVTPTVTIALNPSDIPIINWTGSDANCNYQLYRSAQPYFVSYPRQLASSTSDLSFNDSYVTTASQPIFYRLRALSCDANFDYLEANASYYRDSQEVGAFAFAIVPGN